MRSTRWLLVLSVLAASCRGNERPELALELEWKRSLGQERPALLLGAGGVTMVGTVPEDGGASLVSLRVYPAGDDFLVGVPVVHAWLDAGERLGVALSPTRAVYSQGDTAVVVDLTSGAPPRTWSVRMAPGGLPLVAEGHWLLTLFYADPGGNVLELIDLDQPSSRFTQELGYAIPTKAIAAQGRMLVFYAVATQDVNGWIEVSPELASMGQGFGWTHQGELGVVFEAVVDGEGIVLASILGGIASSPDPGVMSIARLGLDDGRPRWPPSQAIELEYPTPLSAAQGAWFAWAGQGGGVAGTVEEPVPCPRGGYPNVSCEATAEPAYLIEEASDGFHATPILLPYLVADRPKVNESARSRSHALAARSGRLVVFQGPPYELAWYRIGGEAP